MNIFFFFFFQAEDGIRDSSVTGVQTCALPIWPPDGGPPDAGLGCGAGRDAGQACGNGGACSSMGVCVPGFRYLPSNFDPATITSIAPPITLYCNTSFDSTTLAFGNNWCGQPRPVPEVISQGG